MIKILMVAVLMVLPFAAQAQDHAGHGSMNGKTKDYYGSAMHKMHEDMVVKLSGDPDEDFVRGMIPHHQGAVDMAKILIAEGHDPELKKLAQDIIASQEKEIAFMKAWLAKKEQSNAKH